MHPKGYDFPDMSFGETHGKTPKNCMEVDHVT
jgi:hypothetical protein